MKYEYQKTTKTTNTKENEHLLEIRFIICCKYN